MSNPRPLTLEQPLDVDDARRAARKLAEIRRDAEHQLEQRLREAAEAEKAYREAFAVAFVKQEGTASEREALARAEVADLSYRRDLSGGLVKACQERLRGLEGERSMLKSLTDWSARLDPFATQDRSQSARAA